MVDYYTKTEIDSQLTGYTTITYLQGNYMTTLSITGTTMNTYATITFLVDNFYPKTEIDPALSDYVTSTQIGVSYYTKSEIDTTLNLYSPSAQILINFNSKLYINTFISSTQAGALYYNKTGAGNMLLSYSTGFYVDFNFCTKTETDTYLADKLINIGDIELPGWLDIGTSGYTNSRIRCNADIGGYTGFAELRAASSYDMLLNLNTTRTDGGWMYFKINNDDHIQLSSSDNKVNIYKDTTISGNLESQRLAINEPSNDDDIPLQIINNNQNWFVASLESTIAGDGCLMQWMTPASSTYWWSGAWGTNVNEFNIWFDYQGLSIKPTGDVSIGGNLDVGATCNSSIKIHGSGVATAYAELEINSGCNSYWDVQNGNHSQAWSNMSVKGSSFMSFSLHGSITSHTRNFANWSDYRLKGNEIFIKNCSWNIIKIKTTIIRQEARYGK